MEKRGSSFEDHMNIVESATQTKTAGAKANQGDGSLLDKLARELGFGSETEKNAQGVTAPGAPTAEGEVQPAASTVATAAPAVVAATEAVATPQTTIAGGNPAEAAAGEIPAATKPNEGVAISAGDGKVTDANQMHRTPEAVAAAAEDGGGDEGAADAVAPEKAGEMPGQEKEAAAIGRTIATAFQSHLEKQAEDQEYPVALAMLKEAGLLEGYNIKDEGISKTASQKVSVLEKISQKQPLSRKDIIAGAYELVELQKEAEDAEEQGREDARALVGLLTKLSGDEEAETQTEGGEATSSEAAGSEESGNDTEKVSSLLKNPEVVAAVSVLRKNGVI